MTPAALPLESLHPALGDAALESMTFLNEVTERFPHAVSFAPGRPHEGTFDTESVHRLLRTYTRHLHEERGLGEEEVRRTLCQYGRTKGIIHDLIARHLLTDERIMVDPEAIVVTAGCQEALFLVLQALRGTERDAVLAVAPTYVGLTGAARLVGMPVLPVASGPAGIDLADLRAQTTAARSAGQRPRALYLVPDFANPTGLSLDEPTRRRLLAAAEELDLLLLEDSPYALFHSEGYRRPPSLKTLDPGARVVRLGSFAKTVLPGARVGYVVADQAVTAGNRHAGLLADHLAKAKSMLTVNTSPISQAVVGGYLLEHGCSLVAADPGRAEVYRRNLARLLAGLQSRFGSVPWAGQASWNQPDGGFFTVLTLPFPVDDELLELSAREFGVLWTPMAHFYAVSNPAAVRSLRLSCSSLEVDQIDEGLDRLARFIAERVRDRLGDPADGPPRPVVPYRSPCR